MAILAGRPARLDWVDSPVVEQKLKNLVERAWVLASRPDSEPSERTESLLELIEALLNKAENRCAVCGAPINRLQGDWCSEACYNADEAIAQEANEEV